MPTAVIQIDAALVRPRTVRLLGNDGRNQKPGSRGNQAKPFTFSARNSEISAASLVPPVIYFGYMLGTNITGRALKRIPKSTRSPRRRSNADDTEDGTLTDRAYRELEEMIVTLQLLPGTVLSEQALALRLKIGRTPIREALQRLARDGLVVIMPRRGIMVSEINLKLHLRLLEVRRELERLMASSCGGTRHTGRAPGICRDGRGDARRREPKPTTSPLCGLTNASTF